MALRPSPRPPPPRPGRRGAPGLKRTARPDGPAQPPGSTSRTAVFLTNNRPDLVDDAIRDRFLAYSLGPPGAKLLVEVALRRAADHQFTGVQQARLARRVREEALAGELRSVREAERLVVRQYVEEFVGRTSLAQLGEL